ncbi:MAG: RNA-guided pseudouridylation complex pseudouridine synthase subunit Cbf5 [Candidatus Woesearchaeota archaeon]|nr:RNA-guided pseudouridylation complex pseudouridine synthase subunit Cbf5 [Candidatus Woesearchaeota archaeon]
MEEKPVILVRKFAETSPKFGKNPKDRTMEEHISLGIINVDKPEGPTSHQVSAYVQQILGISKSGHSGTLDPNVTGVLPVALLKSTKIVQTLLLSGKEYVCLMHLHHPVQEYDLYKAFEKFTGTITQLPPIKSSVKRQWRDREIYYIDVLEIKDQDVLFKVGCQAGTYIRKLVHDIGQELKCGAHMAELRRTKAGPFTEENLYSLQDISDAFYYYKKHGNEKFLRKVIQPIENAVQHLKRVWIMDTTVDSICHGASLAVPGISKLEKGIERGDIVAIFTLKDELVSFGESIMDTKAMMGEKGLAVKTDKVVMEPHVYPRIQ